MFFHLFFRPSPGKVIIGADFNFRPLRVIAKLFDISDRAVQKQLKIVCDYLGYDNISTHSFRKFYATEIYKNNDCDIELVRHLLQHSSTAITQRYIGIQPPKIEQAISKHICLL